MSLGVRNYRSKFSPKRLQYLGRINFIIDVKYIETQNNFKIIDIDIFVKCSWVDTRWQ